MHLKDMNVKCKKYCLEKDLALELAGFAYASLL